MTRPTNRTRFVRFCKPWIVVCLILLPLAGETQEPRKVRVALSSYSFDYSPYFVAKEKGYYRDEALEVELIVVNPVLGVNALLGANVDFWGSGGTAISAMLRGAPLRLVFTPFNRPMFWIFSTPDIRFPEDLKGKKVGVSVIGSYGDLLIRDFLKKHGIEGRKDAVIIAIPGPHMVRLAALQSRVIDATIVGLEIYQQAREAGFHELFSFVKQGNYMTVNGALAVREELLTSNASLIEKFIRASLRGLLYARTNRSGTVSIISQYLRLKEELLQQLYDLSQPGMTQDGTVSDALQRSSLQIYLELTGLSKPPPLDKMFNFSMTQKVHAELMAAGWRPQP